MGIGLLSQGGKKHLSVQTNLKTHVANQTDTNIYIQSNRLEEDS